MPSSRGRSGWPKQARASWPRVAEAVRERLDGRDRWLLVFDNADAPDDIEHLLPRGGGGRILITSRNPAWPFAARSTCRPSTAPPRSSFLLERTGQHDEAAADALAAELGDLPLALEQAAAYVVETGLSLTAYLDFFRTRRRELWSQERPPAGYPATVGTTWTMAVERLRDRGAARGRPAEPLRFPRARGDPAQPAAGTTRRCREELGAAVADPLRLNGWSARCGAIPWSRSPARA